MTKNNDPPAPQPSSAVQRKRDEDYQEITARIANIASSDPHLFRTIDRDEATFCELYDREAQRIRAEKEAQAARELEEHKARLQDPKFLRRHLQTFESTPRRPPPPEVDELEVREAKERRILDWVKSAPDAETNTFRAAKYLQWKRQNQSVEGGDDGEDQN